MALYVWISLRRQEVTGPGMVQISAMPTKSIHGGRSGSKPTLVFAFRCLRRKEVRYWKVNMIGEEFNQLQAAVISVTLVVMLYVRLY